MLRSRWGFTVIQFIIAMTVAGLLLMAVFIGMAQRSWRDSQRRTDLAQVNALLSRYASNHLGRYPTMKDMTNASSDFRVQYDAMRLIDPKSGKYYVLGTKFDPCDGAAPSAEMGPGYISYKRPGINGGPYTLRMCLEWGREYYIGD